MGVLCTDRIGVVLISTNVRNRRLAVEDTTTNKTILLGRAQRPGPKWSIEGEDVGDGLLSSQPTDRRPIFQQEFQLLGI